MEMKKILIILSSVLVIFLVACGYQSGAEVSEYPDYNYENYELELTPIIVQSIEEIFGQWVRYGKGGFWFADDESVLLQQRMIVNSLWLRIDESGDCGSMFYDTTGFVCVNSGFSHPYLNPLLNPNAPDPFGMSGYANGTATIELSTTQDNTFIVIHPCNFMSFGDPSEEFEFEFFGDILIIHDREESRRYYRVGSELQLAAQREFEEILGFSLDHD